MLSSDCTQRRPEIIAEYKPVSISLHCTNIHLCTQRTLPSQHGGSLEIKLTIPLEERVANLEIWRENLSQFSLQQII